MMFGLENIARKRVLKDSLMICFRCDGCMAEDHKFQWIGTVTGFEKTRFAGWAAQVKVIKRDNSGDWRDRDQGYEIVPIGEPQALAPNFYSVFR